MEFLFFTIIAISYCATVGIAYGLVEDWCDDGGIERPPAPLVAVFWPMAAVMAVVWYGGIYLPIQGGIKIAKFMKERLKKKASGVSTKQACEAQAQVPRPDASGPLSFF